MSVSLDIHLFFEQKSPGGHHLVVAPEPTKTARLQNYTESIPRVAWAFTIIHEKDTNNIQA